MRPCLFVAVCRSWGFDMVVPWNCEGFEISLGFAVPPPGARSSAEDFGGKSWSQLRFVRSLREMFERSGCGIFGVARVAIYLAKSPKVAHETKAI